MKLRKKLIEVALPLDAINEASAREKSIRHGHPSTLHLWWARRPLAAARAVIFAQMVDDPGSWPELFPTEEAQQQDRERLFAIIRELVQWENTTNERVLNQAREEIKQSWQRTCAENKDHPRAKELFNPDKLPGFHDPFAGGGSLPLEAQRLGLEAYASDLNPVAVLINKAMIEIPPKFAGRPPVNPEAQRHAKQMGKVWSGAQGLAEDVRYYGKWMRDEAEKRIGHLYPKVEITAEMASGLLGHPETARPDLKPLIGRKLTVIAWLWARTVKSPNPAFSNVDVPLVSSFVLTPMAGKETYVEAVTDDAGYRFAVCVDVPKDFHVSKNGTKLARGANFRCLMSGTPIEGDYIKAEAMAGRMHSRLLAIVAEGTSGRTYLSPTMEQEAIAREAKPEWRPEVAISGSTQYLGVKPYGMERFDQLFTDRQLVGLGTFSGLVEEVAEVVRRDAIAAGFPHDTKPLRENGAGATAYYEAVSTYLAFLVGKLADKGSTLCTWDAGPASNKTASGRSARVATVRVTFGRQALPMSWDFAEVNFFGDAVGSIDTVLKTLSAPLTYLPQNPIAGRSEQSDAQHQTISSGKVISTDPPYYDNVPYADLSDFFYVWLRRSIRAVFPDIFATLAVPKSEELVAFAYRHEDGKRGAEDFFLRGMTQAMHRVVEHAQHVFPITIYYAFKQTESDDTGGTASTGWETFLDAVNQAGYATTGTWPMRTELGNRMRGMDSNALASSIVLVCRPRETDAPIATRREFLGALKNELPAALLHLQRGNIAPVDLAQSAIGPGMAIYTRYSKVVDSEGKPLPVREALALINQTLDEVLAEQEGDFDSDTRWALAWFEQSGFADGEYGVAETLSKAKNTSVSGLVHAGILQSKAGKVRLLRPEELEADWDPQSDARLTVWEVVHHLVRRLEKDGEAGAAKLVAVLGGMAETARELAYRLYTICERKKRAQEALSYNALVQSWPEIIRLAREGTKVQPQQATMFS
jgi:putative DNA methylase